MALALAALSGCSRAEQLSELAPYLPSLLAALPRLCQSSKSTSTPTPPSRCCFQSLVCLMGHCVRVAELASGALAAAAGGGGGSSIITPAPNELLLLQQRQQQCSSLLAALTSSVGSPAIVDRLLAPLDALLLLAEQHSAELVLFDRTAELEPLLELAHLVHEFVGTTATCTLFEGRTLTRLLRRFFRLNAALARDNQRLEASTAATATATATDEESSDEDEDNAVGSARKSRDERLVRWRELRRRAHVETERMCCCLFGEDLCDLFIWYSRRYALNVDHFYKRTQSRGLRGVKSSQKRSTRNPKAQAEHKRDEELVCTFYYFTYSYSTMIQLMPTKC